jgi:hypothetical protein
MEIKIKPLLFAKSLGICELEAKGTLSRYKTDVAPLNSIMWKPIGGSLWRSQNTQTETLNPASYMLTF